MDWQAWHQDYADPDSALGRRLAVVQRFLAAALDAAPAGRIRLLSMCAGQGHDVLGVLGDHARRDDVAAVLVELDENNAHAASDAAEAAGLGGVEVHVADASVTDAYAGAVPADVVVACGIFGNITRDDIANLIAHLPRLAAPHASVIWTRHRHAPDATPEIRAAFARHGFDEITFETPPPFGVGVHRLAAAPQPFTSGIKLFDFVGYDVLEPGFHAAQTCGRDQGSR